MVHDASEPGPIFYDDMSLPSLRVIPLPYREAWYGWSIILLHKLNHMLFEGKGYMEESRNLQRCLAVDVINIGVSGGSF